MANPTASVIFECGGLEFEAIYHPSIPARGYGPPDSWDPGCGPEIVSITPTDPDVALTVRDPALDDAAMRAIETDEVERATRIAWD